VRPLGGYLSFGSAPGVSARHPASRREEPESLFVLLVAAKGTVAILTQRRKLSLRTAIEPDPQYRVKPRVWVTAYRRAGHSERPNACAQCHREVDPLGRTTWAGFLIGS